MMFIKVGLHLISVKEGAVFNIQPNPKFVRNDVEYGAILLDGNVIGVYPMDLSGDYAKDNVYAMFRNLSKQISDGAKMIQLPIGYKFKSIEEFDEFKAMMKNYSNTEMGDIFYKAIGNV